MDHQKIVVEMKILSSWKVVDGMTIGMTCEIDPYLRTTGIGEHLLLNMYPIFVDYKT